MCQYTWHAAGALYLANDPSKELGILYAYRTFTQESALQFSHRRDPDAVRQALQPPDHVRVAA